VNIDVVIPSYNAGHHARRLLHCLAHNEVAPGDSVEVILVDDGSTDGTGDLIDGVELPFPLTYLYRPRTAESGRAAARNAGIAKGSGDLVLMADADQVVVPGFIAAHASYHKLSDDLVVVGPRGDLAEGDYDDERLALEYTPEALPEVIRGDFRQEHIFGEFSENFNQLSTAWHHTFSCNLSVRREHLEAIGGFDTGFTGWGLEDSELAYRLRRRGLSFAYHRGASAYHQPRVLSDKELADWRRNLAYFIAKHGGVPEVAIQSIILRAFDPDDNEVEWIELMRRFEYAMRGLDGRMPEPFSYAYVEADDADVADVAARLPELASGADLVLLDRTEDARLAGLAQSIAAGRELAYFHRPSAEALARIRSRFPEAA
jgi:GT2 family glycosyltransferase